MSTPVLLYNVYYALTLLRSDTARHKPRGRRAAGGVGAQGAQGRRHADTQTRRRADAQARRHAGAQGPRGARRWAAGARGGRVGVGRAGVGRAGAGIVRAL